jgi:hypothetical protein
VDFGAEFLAHVVFGALVDFEKSEHEAFVRHGVEVVELRHAAYDRIFRIVPVGRRPHDGALFGPDGAFEEVVALPVVTRPAAEA